MIEQCLRKFFFFFNDTATTEIYTLSLHDALPILATSLQANSSSQSCRFPVVRSHVATRVDQPSRSEEHTSELQSRQYLVCRLLLEKKNTEIPSLLYLLYLILLVIAIILIKTLKIS